MPDLLFSLYLLVYFPFSRLWRSFRQAPPKPTVSPLRSYWQRARHLLVLISIFVLLAWQLLAGSIRVGLSITSCRYLGTGGRRCRLIDFAAYRQTHGAQDDARNARKTGRKTARTAIPAAAHAS